MQYRKDRSGEDISILGYGCMRFSRAGSGLDYDKAASELKRAVELGVNYFDTAYLYSGSEELLGRFLEESGLRDKVKIATKLPQYLVRTRGQIDRYFDEELRRLRTDRVDYYLMHMVTSLSQWEGLVKLGIEEWIAEKKASGQIRNIGFSYHGGTKGFLEVLAAYDWDFCQIQYNYLDEHTQAGRAGLEAAAARGIPVIIMEPLRGGKLVDLLPEDARSAIAASPRGWSPAELAFRWLWDQPDVTCVLSGMNSSGRGGLQAGKEQAPSLPYRASPSCHPDAAQTHLGLWTQLRNHNQAHGAQALHAGLSVPRGPFEA